MEIVSSNSNSSNNTVFILEIRLCLYRNLLSLFYYAIYLFFIHIRTNIIIIIIIIIISFFWGGGESCFIL